MHDHLVAESPAPSATSSPPIDPRTLFGQKINTVLDRLAKADVSWRGPFTLRVDTQIGVSRYRIDLAVRDRDHHGRYLLGIECDGATYHSSATARDRDRLRQRELEKLGWTIHRVWSPSWFTNPTGEVDRVLRVVEGLRGNMAEPVAADG